MSLWSMVAWQSLVLTSIPVYGAGLPFEYGCMGDFGTDFLSSVVAWQSLVLTSMSMADFDVNLHINSGCTTVFALTSWLWLLGSLCC